MRNEAHGESLERVLGNLPKEVSWFQDIDGLTQKYRPFA
jgi:hypothetical protein